MELLKKLAITVLLFAAYKAGFFVALIPTDPIMEGLSGENRASLFSLGLSAFLSGYFFTEIAFIIIPKLRAIRNNGAEGRKIINKWALGVSFLIAGIQATLSVQLYSGVNFIGRAGTYIDPNPLSMITHTLFFLAGFVLIFLIGKLISKYGLMNGFCLLIVAKIITQTYGQIQDYVSTVRLNNLNINFIGFIILGLICAFLVYLFQKKDWEFSVKNEKLKTIKVPFFLHGLVAFNMSLNLVSLLIYLIPEGSPILTYVNGANIFSSGLYHVFIIMTSLFSYWMFSSRKRIASNLNINEESIEMDGKPMMISIATMVTLSILFIAPMPFEKDYLIPISLQLLNLCFIITAALDLKDQVVFTHQHPQSIEVFELDNVHLASVMKDKLETAGIPYCIQAYHFRRMFFFFEPFIKMNLLVSPDHKNEALMMLNSIGARNV